MKKLILIIGVLTSFILQAQVAKSSKLYKELRVNDSIIFDASFNTCNLDKLAKYIDANLEFYHDKAGLLEGKEAFIENTKNGLCKAPNNVSRNLDISTLEVHAMYDKNGKLYAAIQQGVHSFYENNTKGGIAKFTHLWVLKDDKWLLKRVLSYDHKPAN